MAECIKAFVECLVNKLLVFWLSHYQTLLLNWANKLKALLSQLSYYQTGPKKCLHQDVPTRWNWTYRMLSSALYYRRALCYFNLYDSNYVSCPTDEEWTRVEKISEFLGGFYEATNSFSGSLYPTSNLYFPHVSLIELHWLRRVKVPTSTWKNSSTNIKKVQQVLVQVQSFVGYCGGFWSSVQVQDS